MDRLQRDRLRWKCRRGLLELDLVLGRFLEREGPVLQEHELGAFAELLETQDVELWDLVTGRADRVDERLRGILERLRACD